LDDIQDDWIHDVQTTVMDTFINSNTHLTPGMIMSEYGNDSTVVNKVQQGKDAGLFELALHGWDHVPYMNLPLSEQQKTLAMANAKLQKIHGEKSNIFIAPYNEINQDTLTAMKNDGIGIVSADLFDDNGFLPVTFPPADPSGIISLPYTVWYVDGDGPKPEGSNGKTVAQLKSEVDASIAQWGWAVVMVHPQDFATFDKNGEAQNTVNATQLSTLKIFIAQIKADGRTITSYQGLIDTVDNTTNNPPPPKDTTRPTGSILTPADGSTVTLNTPFNVTGTASDDTAVLSVEVKAATDDDSDGTDYMNATTSDNFAHWSFNNLSIPDSSFTTIIARITDTSGNQQWVTSSVTIADDSSSGEEDDSSSDDSSDDGSDDGSDSSDDSG
jgi:peptidoglycan/xylan/chitin deacetylase (PgdA/CDA1 family)